VREEIKLNGAEQIIGLEKKKKKKKKKKRRNEG
jgi:hypothetical protein